MRRIDHRPPRFGKSHSSAYLARAARPAAVLSPAFSISALASASCASRGRGGEGGAGGGQCRIARSAGQRQGGATGTQ
eukprot:3767267-Prymnesium_polylepis.1